MALDDNKSSNINKDSKRREILAENYMSKCDIDLRKEMVRMSSAFLLGCYKNPGILHNFCSYEFNQHTATEKQQHIQYTDETQKIRILCKSTSSTILF